MSNEIYGFADLPEYTDLPTLLNTLGDLTPLGVFSVPEDRLIGFPSILHPSFRSFIFMIGDSSDSKNAEYVLDSQDYDPDSAIKLPISADERLSLLTTIFFFLFSDTKCARIAVCLTQGNQIDSVKHLNASQMVQVIKDDCARESPPCILYVITA